MFTTASRSSRPLENPTVLFVYPIVSLSQKQSLRFTITFLHRSNFPSSNSFDRHLTKLQGHTRMSLLGAPTQSIMHGVRHSSRITTRLLYTVRKGKTKIFGKKGPLRFGDIIEMYTGRYIIICIVNSRNPCQQCISTFPRLYTISTLPSLSSQLYAEHHPLRILL